MNTDKKFYHVPNDDMWHDIASRYLSAEFLYPCPVDQRAAAEWRDERELSVMSVRSRTWNWDKDDIGQWNYEALRADLLVPRRKVAAEYYGASRLAEFLERIPPAEHQRYLCAEGRRQIVDCYQILAGPAQPGLRQSIIEAENKLAAKVDAIYPPHIVLAARWIQHQLTATFGSPELLAPEPAAPPPERRRAPPDPAPAPSMIPASTSPTKTQTANVCCCPSPRPVLLQSLIGSR